MLVHPFHQIAAAADAMPRCGNDDRVLSEPPRAVAGTSRRRFFATAITGAAGWLAFLAGRQVEAQQFWRRRYERGPEWDWEFDRRRDRGRDFDRGRRMTTQALGEEGGEYPRPRPPTTLALGEEGGGSWPPRPLPPDRVTTFALGEEGGEYPRPRFPRPGPITTQALGEE